MANYIVTYNIDDATNRGDFVETFEEVLQGLGLQKENTNQSTYFGNYLHPPTPQAFATALHNAISRMGWQINDEITIYFPRVTVPNAAGKRFANIGRHLFKQQGSDFLNHNIIL